MRRAAILGVAAGGVGLGAAGWLLTADAATPAPRASVAASQPVPAATAGSGNPDLVTVEADDAVDSGLTPMAQRVAVVGLLNKRNGVSRDLTMKPGQALRAGDTIVRLRACEQTAPWEQERLTGGFLQLDVRQVDAKWRRVFSGWIYKERPSLNVVLHPVYDIWIKSCTMSFPATGPDTVSIAAPGAPGIKRSSAKKSPAVGDTAGVEDVIPASADDSNPT